MSSISNSYERQAAPEQWATVSYTVRRPGCAAWLQGITTYAEARQECRAADQVVRGHRIYAEQAYVGDLPSLAGATRVVERG
jgi:hypothetical protein